jgi:hypothetical protein
VQNYALAAMPRTIQFPKSKDEQWSRTVIDSTIGEQVGSWTFYEGEALTSESLQMGRLLTGEFECSTFNPARIQIPIAVSAPARLVISCNGKLVWSGDLDGSPSNPKLRLIKVDITNAKEPVAVSELQLQFIFENQPGTIWILFQHHEYGGPVVIEDHKTPYFAFSAWFHAAAWGSILSALIVALSFSRIFGDPRYAAPAALVGAIAGYFGLRDVSKLQLKKRLRRMYGSARGPRGSIVMAILSVLLLATTLGAGTCVYVEWRRFDYTNQITNYLDGQVRDPRILREAFVREPWRREAQILFEQLAFSQRSIRSSFPEWMRFITDDPEVEAAINNASSIPIYLSDTALTASDPTLWLASMLPEGDGKDEWSRTDRAIALLSKGKGCGATLQAIVLQIERLQNDEEAVKGMWSELEQRTRECAALDGSSYGVQLALDMLGQKEIVDDNPAGAVQRFQQLLSFRSRAPESTGLSWRIPDKFALFHMFRYYFDPTDSTADPVNTLAKPLLVCKGFDSMFTEKIYKSESNKKFRGLEGWREGTILDDRLKPEKIKQMLNEGWRF